MIGQDQDTLGGGFFDQGVNGIIDEVRIYGRVLSADEIQFLFDSPSGGRLFVSGTVRFLGDDAETHPAKCVEVNVYDENVVYPDHLVVSGFSDGSGDFYFDQDANGDPIWNEDSEPFGGAPDIYVEVLARSEAAKVSSTQFGLPYGGRTEAITKPSGGLISFGVIAFSDENAGAYAFLLPARTAQDWLGANTGYWAPRMRVVYPDDSGPKWDPDFGGSIHMDRYPFDPYRVERLNEFHHEYGHGIHDEVRPGNGLPGSWDGPTGFDLETDEGTALAEGWARFFQTAVIHEPSDTPPHNGYWYEERIESGASWQGKNPNMVEGSSACIFWDLYDVANDDDVNQQLTRIWAVMSDWDNPPDRMWSPTGDDDFYTYWVTRYGLDQPGNEAEWRAFDEVFIDHGIPVRDDDGEENDTKAEAFDLGTLSAPGTQHPNLICVDEDWWAFTVTAPPDTGDRVSITFEAPHVPTPRGDLDLYVYDSADQLVGESTGTVTSSETVYLDGQPAGTYYVKVIGKNGDFNPNYELTISISDPVSAVPTDLDLPAGYDTGRYDTDDITNRGLPHIVGFAAPNSTVRIYKGPSGSYTLIGTDTADPTGQFDVTVTTPLDEGLNEVTATAEEAGKLESEHSAPPLLITLDTQPPDPPSTPDMTSGSDSGRFLNDDVTNVETPTFQGTAEADSDVTVYEGGTPLGCDITPTGAWSITSSLLSEGSHQLSAKATDLAGNESAVSDTLAIIVDVTAPTISSPSVTPTNCPHPGAVFDVQITATDALSGVQDAWNPEATIRLGDTQVDQFDLEPVGGDMYGDSWDSMGQQPGVYTLDFEAWDLAGNSQTLVDGASLCLAVPADLDEDGDVDTDDFNIFAGCMAGPNNAYPAGCDFADLDTNGDVDLRDFALFQMEFTGQ